MAFARSEASRSPRMDFMTAPFTSSRKADANSALSPSEASAARTSMSAAKSRSISRCSSVVVSPADDGERLDEDASAAVAAPEEVVEDVEDRQQLRGRRLFSRPGAPLDESDGPAPARAGVEGDRGCVMECHCVLSVGQATRSDAVPPFGGCGRSISRLGRGPDPSPGTSPHPPGAAAVPRPR